MTVTQSRGPVVVDTDVFSSRLVQDSLLARRYEPLLARYAGSDLIRTYVELRVACHRAGHALAQREHDADRWIAATAIRLGLPLVSNDGVFENAPGLVLETMRNQ